MYIVVLYFYIIHNFEKCIEAILSFVSVFYVVDITDHAAIIIE